MQTRGQAGQDIFVAYVTNFKKNGYFVEIGSCHYKNDNNSYILEKVLNWSGIMNDIDGMFLEDYKKYRTNSNHIISDATKVNFDEQFKKYKVPQNIDYLQIDLDVQNRSTLDALEHFNKHVFDNYKFATVTFEHDIYTGNHFDTREISRQIFNDRGYILVFPDVWVDFMGKKACFEDWYVHPDLISIDYINKIKVGDSMNWKDIVSHLKKNQSKR